MHTLGINAAFHDSSACLIRDGEIVAAAEEERFTHIKHGKRPIPFSAYELPFNAIDYCLRAGGMRLADLDHVAYSFNPHLLLEDRQPRDHPLFLSSIFSAPRQLVDGAPHHLEERFRGGRAGRYRWHFVPHHLAHAASAFLASPFESAAVLTVDGRGEKTTTSCAFGSGREIRLIREVYLPHSLGLLYERVTSHLGFLHSGDEYKVMALASFGQPRFLDGFLKRIHVEDGGYAIEPPPLERWAPRRLRGEKFEKEHFDLARSLQEAVEETVLRLAFWLHRRTGSDALCLAGGVALNCVMNARLRDESPFRRIWIQPAAGDAGTALGAALWVDAQHQGKKYERNSMEHAYWGPAYTGAEIERFLEWSKLPYRALKNPAEETARILAQDKIIGWFQGRMEFGPRALGGRSILASPVSPSMQARLNDIKEREDFRPVAPAVLEEEAPLWFDSAGPSPFMLFTNKVKRAMARRIPAVRHVDGTARIQTVNRSQNQAFYDLLKAFQKITGVPVLVNTSFNTRGEPIVCSPRDAIESFWSSPLDALVIGPFIMEKPAPGRDKKLSRR